MNSRPRAACLTPPSFGGIAVIQVVGEGAVSLLDKHLRKSGQPLDLARMDSSRLSLCHIIDGDETLDDAVVCIRTSTSDVPVIDLNVHGGPRIVQRVLLMLRREGADIVDPTALLHASWPSQTALQADALALLLHARTRRVAVWLARLPQLLEERIRESVAALHSGNIVRAQQNIDALLNAATPFRYLLDGIHIVLTGPPNSGKSTLANALAECEHAVVSDVPGTTRDWTEHPAAIDGVPAIIVDTAGLRETLDPIETEAIRRAHEQCERADVIVQVADVAAPPTDADAPSTGTAPVVRVLNKIDLLQQPAQPNQPSAVRATFAVSARTGDGLHSLRDGLLAAIGLPRGEDWPIAACAEWQTTLLSQARSLLCEPSPNARAAIGHLENLLSRTAP